MLVFRLVAPNISNLNNNYPKTLLKNKRTNSTEFQVNKEIIQLPYLKVILVVLLDAYDSSEHEFFNLITSMY